MNEFTIKRSEWLRGEGGTKSSLLRSSDKKMCCLGFASLACGYDPMDILGILAPVSLSNKEKYPFSFFTDSVGYQHSRTILEIVNTNDDINIDDLKIEKQLIIKFAELGINVYFID